ncbi:MAG: hypothetical protein R3F29_08860 [Planctomycetota bacterium]
MILATLAGLAVQHWGGVRDATLFGLLAGFVLARFVPAPSSCPLPTRRPDTTD